MLKTIYSFSEPLPEIAYLDPSFIVNILIEDARFHSECVEYSRHLKDAGTTLLLSNLGLDEIWFSLLKVLAIKHLREKNVADAEKRWIQFLRDNREAVRRFSSRIEEDTMLVLRIPNLLVVEISEEQTLKALTTMKKYGLLPRDAIHATATMISGADAIITTDDDFSVVEEIKVYTCNPKSLARMS